MYVGLIRFVGAQMSERVMNVQDAFLNYMRRNRRPVTVFLLGGVKLCGIIVCFDKNSIVLKRGEYTQLVYKHAISNFFPQGTISLFDWDGSKNGEHAEKNEISDEEEFDDSDEYEYDYDEEEE